MALLNLYSVDLKYIRNIQKADTNVESQSPQINKETKFYLGIVILVNEQKYCIPLSSGQKEKYQRKNSNVDMIKIPDLEKKNSHGAPITIAVLNLNNMIPVDDSVISKIDLKIHNADTYDEKKRKGLMWKELNWCRDNKDTIIHRAQKVYNIVTETPEKSRSLVKRCCNFKKLEDVLHKYINKNTTVCERINEPSISILGDYRNYNNYQRKYEDEELDLTDLTIQDSNRS